MEKWYNKNWSQYNFSLCVKQNMNHVWVYFLGLRLNNTEIKQINLATNSSKYWILENNTVNQLM